MVGGVGAEGLVALAPGAGRLPMFGAVGATGTWVLPLGRVASAPPELPGM